MSTQTNNPVLPNEFYNPKNFFTLSGSAAAVWLFCLVLHSVLYKYLNTADQYKIVALTVSELIALVMIYEAKKRSLKYVVTGLFNGILIFIYATGFNTISANLFSSNTAIEE